MAKTTTRPKPTTSKKIEATGTATPNGAAEIRVIPLYQLEPSPLDVRKVAASASDDAELLASIREIGIKQNLVVHALSETRFAVDAGGRRLQALKQLANHGVIPAYHPVPRLVEDERNAVLTSATENLQRERLAIEKLQVTAKPFEGTWKWVEVHLSVDYGAFRSFGRVYPQDIEPDPALLAEEERLIAREEELAAQSDGEDWTDAETEEYYGDRQLISY